MQRMLVSLLALLLFPGVTSVAARAQDGDVHMLDLPVLVAMCERDPGTDINPGGGRGNLEEVLADHGCERADGVSVTVSHRPTANDDLDFFARCETDKDGICTVNAPTDPERELTVALHMATVAPGYAPARATTRTVHYTEFTGVGIALLPDPKLDKEERAALPERRTLALKIEQDGKPAEVLAQLSEAEVMAANFPWLATNEEGWMSFDLGSYRTPEVDLILSDPGKPQIACTDLSTDAPLVVASLRGPDGAFTRIVLPETDGDVRCDVSLP